MPRPTLLALFCATAFAAGPVIAAPPALADLGPDQLAQAVSDDGQVVVGLSVAFDGAPHPDGVFRWTPEGGSRVIGGLVAGRPAVSADGATVAATMQVEGIAQAAFWTVGGGWKPIADFGLIPPLPGWETGVQAISGNGQRLAGTTLPPPLDYGRMRAFSFNPDTWIDRPADYGWQELPLIRKGSFAEATAITDDGQTQIGRATDPGGIFRAVRWRDGRIEALRDAGGAWLGGESVVCNRDCSVIAGGGGGSSAVRPVLAWRLLADSRAPACMLQPLDGPRLLSLRYYAYGTSRRGEVIVGAYYYDDPEQQRNIARGFVWIGDARGGLMHDLQDYLAALGQPALAGWYNVVPTGVSGDGRYLVGWGDDPQGRLRGWRIDFGAAPQPRPDVGGKGSGTRTSYTRCPQQAARAVVRADSDDAADAALAWLPPDGSFTAAGRRYLVRSRGAAVYGGASEATLQRLLPLGGDHYYDPATRTRRSFQRDAAGLVQRMRVGFGRSAQVLRRAP